MASANAQLRGKARHALPQCRQPGAATARKHWRLPLAIRADGDGRSTGHSLLANQRGRCAGWEWPTRGQSADGCAANALELIGVVGVLESAAQRGQHPNQTLALLKANLGARVQPGVEATKEARRCGANANAQTVWRAADEWGSPHGVGAERLCLAS